MLMEHGLRCNCNLQGDWNWPELEDRYRFLIGERRFNSDRIVSRYSIVDSGVKQHGCNVNVTSVPY